MSMRIFCKDCPNNGSPVKGDPDIPFGFEIQAPMVSYAEMSTGIKSTAEILGAKFQGNAVAAVINAWKQNELKCVRCGSANVDLITEVDLEQSRKEAKVVEDIDFGISKGSTEGHIPNTPSPGIQGGPAIVQMKKETSGDSQSPISIDLDNL